MTRSASPAGAEPDAATWLRAAAAEVDAWLDGALPRPTGAETAGDRLAEALRYPVFAGGKRLRPALALAACEAVGGARAVALPFAGALELVHTYSLVHDDLPAMDDDDLRRGRPTCHRAFGEALAILAGDALLTLAFELLLRHVEGAERARALALLLARAAGPSGMVGGQVEDVAPGPGPLDEATLLRVHGRKTAALIAAACEGGALLGGADARLQRRAARCGRHLGLGFQVVDDVLDATSTREVLGKTPGRDAAHGRPTWVALLGVAGARARARAELARALEAAAGLPHPNALAALARLAVERDR